jgi:ribose transport system permease protein
MKSKIGKHGSYRDIIPISTILGITLIIMAIMQRNFFSLRNFSLLCRQLSPYIFITMSQTIIMIIGGMDFSAGSMLSLSTCIFATNLHYGIWNVPAIIAILAICGTFSSLIGLLISWFKLPSIVVTLATSFVLTGAALAFLPTPGGTIPRDIAIFLTSDFGHVPVSLIAIIFFVLLWVYVKRSSVGLLLFSVGANKEAARISGLSVHKAYLFGYFLSGVLSAMAGLMLSAITMSGDPTIGTYMMLNSVTAAVLGGVSFSGGKGKMVGAIAGAIVVGMLVNILFYLGITGFYKYVVQGLILILAVSTKIRNRHAAAAAA